MELADNEIHLWFIHPKARISAELLERYRLLLSSDETERVKRFKFNHLQQRALITRALVRTSLSHYCDCDPAQWKFEIQAKGKPELINPPLPLRFNISHSKNMIICAITLNDDVGVDIEKTQPRESLSAIADRYFSPAEVSELSALTGQEQNSRFFDYWTLKESYIKAKGLGLSIPLDQFSFHIDNQGNHPINRQISLTFDAALNDQGEHWQSWLCYPNDQYRMALSIHNKQQKHKRLRFFEFIPLKSFQETDLPFSSTARNL
jgi:4'-phosphopantetheinyl transferase